MNRKKREVEVLTSQAVTQKLSQNDVFQTESNDPLESYYVSLMSHDWLNFKIKLEDNRFTRIHHIEEGQVSVL